MMYMVSGLVTSISEAIMNSPIGAAYNGLNYLIHLGGLI